MDSVTKLVLYDLVIVAALVYLGFLYRFKTPPFQAKNGLRLIRPAYRSAAVWLDAHRFCGLLALIAAGAVLGMILLYFVAFSGREDYLQCMLILQIALMLLIIPATFLRIGRRYDKRGNRR